MGRPLLEVSDLRTYLESPRGIARAVDGVSFSLDAGRTLGLVGESGCGKSVTALSLLRLVDPEIQAESLGSIRFAGIELTTLPERKMREIRGGRIAMVFQEPGASLNPVLSIGSQIIEAIRLHRPLSRRSAREEALRLLAEVRIPDPPRRLRQFPHELSGGMKQRAMIAMALAGEPELLIADEPTTALDVTVEADVLDLLTRIQRERGLAILLITHDLGVVAQMADDVSVMYAGRIAESGPVKRIFDEPRHPYTKGLLASLPRMDRPQERPRPILGVVPPATHWPSGCRFRERCPAAFERCEEDPPMIPVEKAHAAACWLCESEANVGDPD